MDLLYIALAWMGNMDPVAKVLCILGTMFAVIILVTGRSDT